MPPTPLKLATYTNANGFRGNQKRVCSEWQSGKKKKPREKSGSPGSEPQDVTGRYSQELGNCAKHSIEDGEAKRQLSSADT